MNLMARLKRLESSLGIDRGNVYFVEQDSKENRMEIPQLNFQGTSEEGFEFMKRYPNSVFIIDDIPRDKVGAVNVEKAN